MGKIKSILALTRWTEVYDFTIVLTLFGAIAANGSFDIKFVILLIANFLCLCHAFMFNDVEDAEEDAQNPKKLKRNPIANKSLSKKEGFLYSNITLALSAGLYIYLWFVTQNPSVIIVGGILLLINVLYSYRKIRLKAIPIIDVITHMFMLSSGPYLVAYFVYNNTLDLKGFLLFLILSGISGYGQLENETRDFETDVKTNVKTTAVVLGLKLANIIKFLFLIISGVSILVLAFSTDLIKSPFIILLEIFVVFAIIGVFLYIRFRKHRNQVQFTRELQQAILFAANIVLLLLFLKVNIY